jgi:arsenate reductase
MNPENKLKVLFLCTGNSCRSQMAQGYAVALKSDLIDSFSAGVIAAGMNPMAIKVMAEDGVDISGQFSKVIDELPRDVQFDYVITLCDHAASNCPFFPGHVKRMHNPFDDPPTLARAARSEAEALRHFRRVRDEIKQFIKGMPDNLG